MLKPALAAIVMMVFALEPLVFQVKACLGTGNNEGLCTGTICFQCESLP
jgi:hypothetical protein